VDFAKLEDAIMRLSQFIADFDFIEELDINPFFVSERPEDCKAADARIRIRLS
jgi:succinyl-CoA synthetase beta subunit